MSPQFVDFNADGHQDFIAATYEGTVFLVAGSKEGWGEPEHIQDSQGRNVVISFYYDMEENTYKNADRSPEGLADSGDHCVSATAYDWDADGDLDLLLGAYGGALYRQMNEGKPGAPAYTGVNIPVTAGDSPFSMPGGLTAARLVDWNKDGLQDLVCGGFKGGASVLINRGKLGAPRFDAPKILIAKSEERGGPSTGLYVDPVDYDGDGDLDLLVGGNTMVPARSKPLTEEENLRHRQLQEELAALEEALDALFEELTEATAGLSPEERQAVADEFMSREDVSQALEQMQEVQAQISKMGLRPTRETGVWLYRRR